MPRIVITHDVVDIERWLKGKDERAAASPRQARTSPTMSRRTQQL
jgi:hypothetical protein